MNAHPKSRRDKPTRQIIANLDEDVWYALHELSERLKVAKSELANMAVRELTEKLRDAKFGHRFS